MIGSRQSNPMAPKRTKSFNPKTFIAKIGTGKTSLASLKDQTIFSQGDAADAVFFIQTGKVKLSVVSQQGKEAILAMLEPGAFFGQSCLVGQSVRTATATAVEDDDIVRINKAAMIRVLHEEPFFSELFMSYLLSHNIRSKRIWWINSLTPARSGWRECCCCWRILGKKASRRQSLRRSVKKRWRRWSVRRGHG